MPPATPAEPQPLPLPPLPETPLVSVLMANYNYAPFVEAAIRSVLAQTYPRWELLVCDDGSTDGSRAVIEPLAASDARIRLIAKENGGQASALNACYEASRGEVVCVLDADDLFAPDKLARVVEAFRAHPDRGFAVHPVVQIGADGRGLARKVRRDLVEAWVAPALLRAGRFPKTMPPASALCVRRAVADLLFPIDERFVRAADGVVQYGAALVTPVVLVDAPLAYYRLHGANLSAAATWSAAQWIKMREDYARLHADARALLERHYGPAVARRWPALEDSAAYRSQQATIAVLEGAPTAERNAKLDRLFAVVDGHGPSHAWMYRVARYLPPAAARRLFLAVMSESAPKRLFRRLRAALNLD